nr:PREDICTED: uncharacterized protein LOC108951240 [Musa acuminata subsp. malaccensis]
MKSLAVCNYLSHGLGADAARFGSPNVGDLGRRPSGSPGGRAQWFGSGGSSAATSGRGDPVLPTCTQVGPGARPDPSDDQISDVEGIVDEAEEEHLSVLCLRAGQYLSWRLTLPLGLRGEPGYRRVWARLGRRAPLPRSSARSQMLRLLAESW